MSVSYGGDSITFADGSVQSGGWTGFRNRLINGAMVIDQRNNGVSVTPTTTNTYTLDRWRVQLSVTSKYSVQQNAGSVTPPPGYINYLGVTSLSAYTVGSSELFNINQVIEGLNIADLGWGTADAKTVTLSFWVYSSLTGTFGGVLKNNGGSRTYPYTYTISSANTWEQKSITIAGDTSGTWLTTNGIGLQILFSLGTGSTVSGTAGSWSSTNYSSATGATSVVGTNGATFYITGVQLERGSTASSFEYRPYGTELQLCQRYFITDLYAWVGGGATPAAANRNFATSITFPVTMRSTPVITKTGTETLLLMNTPTFDFTTSQHTRYIATNSAANDCYAYTTFNAAIEL